MPRISYARLAWVGVFTSLLVAGCSGDTTAADEGDDLPLTTASADERERAAAEDISDFTLELPTSEGTAMFRAARYWLHEQAKDPRYPKPRMCASNISKIFFLAGDTDYDAQGVRALMSMVHANGGMTFKMPQTKAAFVAKLNAIHNGHLPVGTLVAGMNVHSANPGDQHIGMVGHVDDDGVVWTYHNNWYRPENEHGQRKPFMISDENLQRGFQRQWMAVPWLRLTRDSSGAIVDVETILPAIDDMDPFNSEYSVTLAIPPQIEGELTSGSGELANSP